MSDYQITEDVREVGSERYMTLAVLAPTFDEVVSLYRAAKLARAEAEADIAIGLGTHP